MTSNFQLYDSVQLSMDLPQHGLQRGTRGAIVEVYGSDGYEVEVFDADGFTIDVLTLKGSQLAMLGQVVTESSATVQVINIEPEFRPVAHQKWSMKWHRSSVLDFEKITPVNPDKDGPDDRQVDAA